jgi:hypothetical protein
MFDLLDCEEHELFLTGKQNFRNDIAVTAPYKGNRKDKEAESTYLSYGNTYKRHGELVLVMGRKRMMTSPYEQQSLVVSAIIVSIDKDFMQVPGWHYNFVKKVKKQVTPEEGLRFFYKQILMGDAADNIKGIHRVGEVRAKRCLPMRRQRKSCMRVVWRRWAQSVCWKTVGCCGYAGQQIKCGSHRMKKV